MEVSFSKLLKLSQEKVRVQQISRSTTWLELRPALLSRGKSRSGMSPGDPSTCGLFDNNI